MTKLHVDEFGQFHCTTAEAESSFTFGTARRGLGGAGQVPM